MLAVLGFALSNWRGALYAAAVASLVGWGLYYRHELILKGEAEAVEQVRQANELEAEKAARAAKTVDDCYAADPRNVWDRDLGVCVHPAR